MSLKPMNFGLGTDCFDLFLLYLWLQFSSIELTRSYSNILFNLIKLNRNTRNFINDRTLSAFVWFYENKLFNIPQMRQTTSIRLSKWNESQILSIVSLHSENSDFKMSVMESLLKLFGMLISSFSHIITQKLVSC